MPCIKRESARHSRCALQFELTENTSRFLADGSCLGPSDGPFWSLGLKLLRSTKESTATNQVSNPAALDPRLAEPLSPSLHPPHVLLAIDATIGRPTHGACPTSWTHQRIVIGVARWVRNGITTSDMTSQTVGP